MPPSVVARRGGPPRVASRDWGAIGHAPRDLVGAAPAWEAWASTLARTLLLLEDTGKGTCPCHPDTQNFSRRVDRFDRSVPPGAARAGLAVVIDSRRVARDRLPMVRHQADGRRADTWGAGRIALIYAGVAGLWILVSDRVVEAVLPSAEARAAAQTGKALFFVVATAGLLWGLVLRRLRQVRLAEVRRSASEDRLATFAENMPGTAYIKDADGRFLFIRGQTTAGLPAATAMVGKTAHDVLDAPTADRLWASDQDVLRTGTPSQLVETIELGGRPAHYLIHRFPLRGPDGQPLLGGVAFDVTERTNAEARIRDLARELEAANRQKDQFLSNLSHELRTPVTAIRLWVDVLKSSAARGDLPSVQEAAGMIENSAVSQTQLIDDLLDVTRIIGGKLTLERGRMDLAAVVRQTAALLGPMADEREVAVDAAAVAGPAPVVGDARRVQQVVWNLLTNAIKFSRARGRVRASLARDGDEWVLAVADNGVGIPPDLLPKLFERFRQADTSRTRAEGGLGIGLSLVKHMVEAHGGSVAAESGGAGAGSTFVVRLPVAQGAAAAAGVGDRAGGGAAGRAAQGPPVAVVAAPATAPLAGRRVLLVEDNADSRTGMALLLGRAGATVKSADDVDSALSAGDEFDVLLSDIGLPDRDGCELIAELRRRPRWHGRPALAISAYALPEDRKRALAAGFDEFVVKPVDPDALIATVVERLRAEDDRQAVAVDAAAAPA
jgi:signal transduction histidine kinase/ActR/RegA family two-component response regulator